MDRLNTLPYDIFNDIHLDFTKEKKDYRYIIYDLIGLTGILLILGTYIYHIHYFLYYKSISGVSRAHVYVKLFGFILVLLYAYLRKDFEGTFVLSTIFFLLLFYYLWGLLIT